MTPHVPRSAGERYRRVRLTSRSIVGARESFARYAFRPSPQFAANTLLCLSPLPMPCACRSALAEGSSPLQSKMSLNQESHYQKPIHLQAVDYASTTASEQCH